MEVLGPSFGKVAAGISDEEELLDDSWNGLAEAFLLKLTLGLGSTAGNPSGRFWTSLTLLSITTVVLFTVLSLPKTWPPASV